MSSLRWVSRVRHPDIKHPETASIQRVTGVGLVIMAYLPRIEDPSVFCDSSVFSDITSTCSSTLFPTPMSQNAGNPPNSEKKAATTTTAFPILPPAHNFSTLGNLTRFETYIATQLPMAQAGPTGGLLAPLLEAPASEKGSNKINSEFFRGLLKNSFKQSTHDVF